MGRLFLSVEIRASLTSTLFSPQLKFTENRRDDVFTCAGQGPDERGPSVLVRERTAMQLAKGEFRPFFGPRCLLLMRYIHILNQVQKVINDVYRSFNTFQSPFNVLDLQLPPGE